MHSRFLLVVTLLLTWTSATSAGNPEPLKSGELDLFRNSATINATALEQASKAPECSSNLNIKPINVQFASLDGKPNDMQILPLELKKTGRQFSGGWEEHTLTLLMGSPLKKNTWTLRIKNDESGQFVDLKRDVARDVIAVKGFGDVAPKDAFRFQPSRVCDYARPQPPPAAPQTEVLK